MEAVVNQIGPYLSTCGFVLREWLSDHRGILTHSIQAYVQGPRWALNPENKLQAIALLVDWLGQPKDIVRAAYRIATDPVTGAIARWHEKTVGQNATSPNKYLDLSLHEAALAGL